MATNPATTLLHVYNHRLSADERMVLAAPKCAARMAAHAHDSLQRARDNVRRILDDASPETINEIPEASHSLWTIVLANDWLDSSWRELASVFRACRVAHPEAYYGEFPGKVPNIYVPITMGAGEAQVDQLTNFTTNIQGRVVPLRLHDVNRTGKLDYYTFRNGAELRQFLSAFRNSVNAKGFGLFIAAVQGLLPAAAAAAVDTTPAAAESASTGNYGLVDVDKDAFTPQYVTQSVAPIFGDKGRVDSLLLTPGTWGMLQRFNALGLPLEDEQYGIRHFERTGQLDSLGSSAQPGLAIAMQRDAMIVANDVQKFGDDLANPYDIIPIVDPETGFKMQLRMWNSADDIAIKFSMETMLGFAPGLLDRLTVFRQAAAPSTEG